MPARRRWDPYFRSPFLGRELRRATHRSILGPDPRCACGETRHQALTRQGRELVCYECQSVEQGRSRIEQDHPLGRGERWLRYTRPLAGNRHRLVSHPDVDAFDAWADVVPDGAGQDLILSGLGFRFGTSEADPPLTADVIVRPDGDPVSQGRLEAARDQPLDSPPGSTRTRAPGVRGTARPA